MQRVYMQNQNTEKAEKCPPLTIWQKLAQPFPYEDLEWRIAQAGKSKDGQIRATCFAYVSARAIQDRLDSIIGPPSWKAEYYIVPGAQDVSGGILCSLSLCVDGAWISKQDGADQTDTEKFKGGLSSAFKRAAVLWGVGRYLYDLDTNWAIIVDRGVRGARYGQTKEKEPFYWLSPELPEWALPKVEGEKDEHHGSVRRALPGNQ